MTNSIASLHSDHHDPFEVLGAHLVEVDGAPVVSVRAYLPFAERAWVMPAANGMPDCEHAHPDGIEMTRYAGTDFFEAHLAAGGLPVAESPIPRYKLRSLDKDGVVRLSHDPYSFQPVLGDLDLLLYNEGNHFRTYDKLGAHLITHGGVDGTVFAVWAPNARRVSVTGDFNRWDGRQHPMRQRGSSGIWELFLPGLGEGALYKYEVKTKDGALLQKTDPQGFFAEMRPKTASVVWDIDKRPWGDAAWLQQRALTDPLVQPMAIYEVHLGSWMRVPGPMGTSPIAIWPSDSSLMSNS